MMGGRIVISIITRSFFPHLTNLTGLGTNEII
jgi:hypothetical protein